MVLFPNNLIAIRHAESEANINKNVYQHTPDWQISITSIGLNKIRKLGEKILNYEFNSPNLDFRPDRIILFHSSYVRSQQTAEILAESLNKKYDLVIQEDPRIREQHWGNKIFTTLDRQHLLNYRSSYGEFHYQVPDGGESLAQVYDRLASFLTDLRQYIIYGPEASRTFYIMISHELTLKVLTKMGQNIPINKFSEILAFKNLESRIYELTPYSIIEKELLTKI